MALIPRLMKRVYRLRSRPIVADRLGCTLLLDPKNWIDNRLLARAPYEERQLANARRLVAENRLDTVVDIGANFGLYSCVLGRMPGVETVLAFEPSRRNHSQLMANVFLNALHAKVRTFDVALGAENRTEVLHIDPTSTGVSRLDPGGSHRDAGTWRERESVEVRRFDDLVDLERRNAFVKIDVEGAAVGVLAGMTRFLRRNRAFVQVEISPAESGAHAVLAECGYREIAAIGSDVIFAADPVPAGQPR